jgi:hypothetical protein
MTKPYKHKLTEDELVHLKEFNLSSMTVIENNMKLQIENRKTTVHEPCYVCKGIAEKLGFPV